MEPTAAARGASLAMHSPQLSRQEWRAVADNHSARDAADEVRLSSYLRVSCIVFFASAQIGDMDSNAPLVCFNNLISYLFTGSVLLLDAFTDDICIFVASHSSS